MGSTTVAGDELRQFVEILEQLDAETRDVAERKKERMAEIKGRGYDPRIVKKIVALRKKSADARAEEESITELYMSALGMS